MDAAAQIIHIHIRKVMLESLIQWVKVVYEEELHQQEAPLEGGTGSKPQHL